MVIMTNLLNLISSNGYVKAAIILFVFFFVAKLLVVIVEKIILKLTAKTKTEVDDALVKKTNKPISFILLLIGIRLAIIPMGFVEITYTTITNIIYSLIIFTVGYMVFLLMMFSENIKEFFAKKAKH